MRTKEEIMKEMKSLDSIDLLVEVLLDIRDLLAEGKKQTEDKKDPMRYS